MSRVLFNVNVALLIALAAVFALTAGAANAKPQAEAAGCDYDPKGLVFAKLYSPTTFCVYRYTVEEDTTLGWAMAEFQRQVDPVMVVMALIPSSGFTFPRVWHGNTGCTDAWTHNDDIAPYTATYASNMSLQTLIAADTTILFSVVVCVPVIDTETEITENVQTETNVLFPVKIGGSNFDGNR